MSNNTFYYQELVDCIVKIFNIYNKEKYLNELNINKDLCVLSDVFLEPINYIKEHYLSWNDETWINSTKYVKLGLLSFLYKNKASLYKIYTLVENNDLYQCVLLEKYKNLFKDLMANKNLSSIQNYIIQENVELDEIEKKKYYLILNMKNFKNPKFAAYLFDILTYKVFRKNIFNYLLKNIKQINNNVSDKINIDEITKIENECNNIFISKIDEIIENGYLYNFCNFLMFLDFGKNKQICVNKHVYQKINDYIKDVLEKSSKIHTYLDLLVAKNKNAEKVFKSDISLVIISEDVTSRSELNYYVNTKSSKFEEAYKNSNNIELKDVNFDEAFIEAFREKSTIKFNKRDFINRISHLIYITVEYVTVVPKKDIKFKLESLNDILQNTFQNIFEDDEEDQEFNDIIKEIKNNGLIKRNFDNITHEEMITEIYQQLNEIIDELLQTSDDIKSESVAEIKEMFNACIIKLQYYKNSNNFNDFNVFSELVDKIIKNKDLFKILLIEILQEKYLIKFLNIIEKITLFKFNTVCKQKIIELVLNFIKQIIEFININNEKEYLNNTKILIFMAKILDKFYIVLNNFSNITNDKTNVKTIMKFNSVRKNQNNN